jgi:hypothetical protein
MAGDRIDVRDTGVFDSSGRELTKNVIVVNGNVEPGDEWAHFRLTDEGLVAYYDIGCEMKAGILGITFRDEPVVHEVARFSNESKAREEWGKLSADEQHRTLIRSVRPKPKL